MENTGLGIVFLLALTTGLQAAEDEIDMNEMSSMMYLDRYGYMDTAMEMMNMTANDFTHDVMVKATEEFQTFMGLNVTGKLDKETRSAMMKPRCGVKDMMGPAYRHRTKRYAHLGSVWETRRVSYKITRFTHWLDADTVRSEFQRAGNAWAKHVNVMLVPTKNKRANVIVRFGRRNHGDPWPFDGRHGVLAHASQPRSEAFVHFDNDEPWSAGRHGRNFYQTALHEIGHVLGLDHSMEKEAVMFPTVGDNNPDLLLHPDDIRGIKALYDRRFGRFSVEEEGPRSTTIIDKDLCKDPVVDVMFSDMNGDLIVFKGDKMYAIAPEGGVLPRYPRLISRRWPDLPSNIQAAFTNSDGGTYFLKGSQVWKYVGSDKVKGYPKSIEKEFPRVPSDVDAAMQWDIDGRLYFFKGNKFWSVKNGKTSNGSISTWTGIPSDLTAAFRYMGNSNFIKGNKYYMFDDTSLEVAMTETVSSKWFGCPEPQKEETAATSEPHRGAACLQHTGAVVLTFSTFILVRGIA